MDKCSSDGCKNLTNATFCAQCEKKKAKKKKAKKPAPRKARASFSEQCFAALLELYRAAPPKVMVNPAYQERYARALSRANVMILRKYNRGSVS